MEIPNELVNAALAARDRLSGFARAAATQNTGPGTAATGSMARAANAAIFIDALTSAIHARLEEIKLVAK